MALSNYEEVDVYPLEEADRERLLAEQIECTFMWGTREHWPVGVIMTYVWKDGSFWLSATSQRKRIAAIKRDPRVCIAVSSVGTEMGPARTATAKGRAIIHEDRATKDWFYPACAATNIPAPGKFQDAFAAMMESDRRLVIEVVPEKWITFDGAKMMAASVQSWRASGLLD